MKHKALLNKLLLLVTALTMTGLLPAAADDEIQEGWYYLTNTTKAGNFAAGNALTVQNGYLTIDFLDPGNPDFIFYLKKAEGTSDSNYYLYNLGEDSWYQGAACLNTGKNIDYLTTTNAAKALKDENGILYRQILPGFYFKKDSTKRKYFTFTQYNSTETYNMIPEVQENLTKICKAIYSNSTDYSKNFVITTGGRLNNSYTGAVNLFGTPYFKTFGLTLLPPASNRLHVTFKDASGDLQTAKMKVALRKADTALSDNTLFNVADKLVTSEDQLFSTTSNSYAPIAKLSNLVDGKSSPTYASVAAAQNDAFPTKIFSPSYIQADVKKSTDTEDTQVQGIQLQLQVGTTNNYPNGMAFPTDITIFGSNADETVAESTTEDTELSDVLKSDSWTKIGDFNFEPYLSETEDLYNEEGVNPTILNTSITNSDSQTKNIVFPTGQYRFLRFYVNHTTVDISKSHLFQISELGLKELTDITATHGLQNDIKTLRELTANGNTKIQKGTTVSDEDLTALETAINNLSSRRTVSITEIGYASFVSDVNVTLPDGLTAYYITATDNNKATLTEVAGAGEVLPAGKPVILKGDANKEYVLTVATGDAKNIDASLENKLEGVADKNQSQADGTTYYTLQNNNGTAVFKKYSAGNTLKAGYAYLPVTSTSGSPAFLNLSFDAATGIQSAVNTENNKAENTYDLEGRSVKHPQKGIYIRGGKKVIIK